MKDFKKFIVLLLAFSTLSGCMMTNIDDAKVSKDSDSDNASTTNDSSTSVSSLEANDSVKIKNFNRLNMSYSKVTGIHRGTDEVAETLELILNQLPADNELDSFSPFQQISIIRLAFTYCDLYIDENENFSDLDYSSVENEVIANLLIDNLLDDPPESDPNLYATLKSEVLSTLNNEAGEDVEKFISSDNNASSLKKKLTKMSCSLVLSSTFMTMI